jgi:hypothetical protein
MGLKGEREMEVDEEKYKNSGRWVENGGLCFQR